MELSSNDLSTPVFSSLLSYSLLLTFFFVAEARNTVRFKWTYFLNSLFDFIALNANIRAFQMTLISSVTMIYVLTVVTSSLLSVICFRVQYLWSHYLAILLCVCGVLLTLYSHIV